MFEREARETADIRFDNTRRVLEVLRREQPISRKDITPLAGMSPASITRIVSTLMSQSLIEECEGVVQEATGRGRRAVLLRINPDGLYTLGILVEEERVHLSIQDFDGVTLFSDAAELPAGATSPEAVVRNALSLYRRMPQGILRAPAQLQGAGVSLPGMVDARRGIVTRSDQMEWREVDMRTAFQQALGLPVWIENDVKAALAGECHRLHLENPQNLAYIYLGRRGLGAAVISGGVMVRGAENAAGEIAHISFAPEDALCACGQRGCMQLHLLETYLVERARRIEPGAESARDILAAGLAGRAWAREITEDFGRHVRILISMVESLCDPETIFLGGETAEGFRSYLQESMESRTVRLAGDYAATSARGAAAIAMQRTLARLVVDG